MISGTAQLKKLYEMLTRSEGLKRLEVERTIYEAEPEFVHFYCKEPMGIDSWAPQTFQTFTSSDLE
jgi:hypothetical protein